MVHSIFYFNDATDSELW